MTTAATLNHRRAVALLDKQTQGLPPSLWDEVWTTFYTGDACAAFALANQYAVDTNPAILEKREIRGVRRVIARMEGRP